MNHSIESDNVAMYKCEALLFAFVSAHTARCLGVVGVVSHPAQQLQQVLSTIGKLIRVIVLYSN